MQASAWNDGGNTYGIRVGFVNRSTYFDSTWSAVEVEIDQTWHTFALTKGFWNKCPEFRDRGTPVIRNWLSRHYSLIWLRGNPPRFELLSLGENRFRLVAGLGT
jgi:hypothetical protein